jgi:hypothetical protein
VGLSGSIGNDFRVEWREEKGDGVNQFSANLRNDFDGNKAFYGSTNTNHWTDTRPQTHGSTSFPRREDTAVSKPISTTNPVPPGRPIVAISGLYMCTVNQPYNFTGCIHLAQSAKFPLNSNNHHWQGPTGAQRSQVIDIIWQYVRLLFLGYLAAGGVFLVLITVVYGYILALIVSGVGERDHLL